MTVLDEWVSRKHHLSSVMVTVTEHKTDDKLPATIVIDEEMEDLMER